MDGGEILGGEGLGEFGKGSVGGEMGKSASRPRSLCTEYMWMLGWGIMVCWVEGYYGGLEVERWVGKVG